MRKSAAERVLSLIRAFHVAITIYVIFFESICFAIYIPYRVNNLPTVLPHRPVKYLPSHNTTDKVGISSRINNKYSAYFRPASTGTQLSFQQARMVFSQCVSCY